MNEKGVQDMATFDTIPWVWVKDNGGTMYLCPYDQLRDPNILSAEERGRCIHDASDLASIDHIPSNAPNGKVRFAESASLN